VEGCVSQEHTVSVDPATAGAWDIFGAWMAGAGGKFNFGDGDFYTEQLKLDVTFNRFEWDMMAALKDGVQQGRMRKDLGQNKLLGVHDILQESWEVLALGSYDVSWGVDTYNKDETAKVWVHVSNTMSNESLTHYAGYKGAIHDGVTRTVQAVNNVPPTKMDFLFDLTLPTG
jgi:hypothetical protein